LIKNSKTVWGKCQKTAEGDFLDSHCTSRVGVLDVIKCRDIQNWTAVSFYYRCVVKYNRLWDYEVFKNVFGIICTVQWMDNCLS